MNLFFGQQILTVMKTLNTLEKKLSPKIKQVIQEKTIIDFGCGFGEAAIAISKSGAKKVYGLDIREFPLSCGRELAIKNNSNCQFVMNVEEKVDIVISIDAFEHFF